jgi:DNA processing protein
MSLLAWLTLSFTDGLGPVLSRRLVDAFGNVDAAVKATAAQLRAIEGIGSAKSSSIAASLVKAGDEAAREFDRAAAMSIEIIHVDDARYPLLLRMIHGPPPILYLKGKLEPRDIHAVGIVGSRKCSVYGREQAERFGANLAGVGVTVVSGGARGIDTHAHKGALVPKNGRTIAVLGSGVDVAYPPENAGLFDQIVAAGGAILSEFPLGTPPTAENFPRRNRIVSGLSRGILVVEADVKSGALITAKYAVEHERVVLAMPGRIDNPLSAGPHALIRDGAVLVENISDILDNLGPLPDADSTDRPATLFDSPVEDERLTPAAPPVKREISGPALSVRQQAIVDALRGETLDVDAIAERVELLSHVVLGELTMLTLRGAVQRVDGQKFALRRN